MVHHHLAAATSEFALTLMAQLPDLWIGDDEEDPSTSDQQQEVGGPAGACIYLGDDDLNSFCHICVSQFVVAACFASSQQPSHISLYVGSVAL